MIGSWTGAPLYLLELAQTRTLSPAILIPISGIIGLAALAMVAVFGRVAYPALPGLRRTFAEGSWRSALHVARKTAAA
jgi:hypothetical protein